MEDYRDLIFYENIYPIPFINPRDFYMKRTSETHRKAGRNYQRNYARKLKPPKKKVNYYKDYQKTSNGTFRKF